MDYRRIACLTATVLATGAVSATAAPASWQGEWRLNVDQSHYPAGFPVIHDHVMQVTKSDPKALQYTDNFAVGDQPPTHVSFDGAFDGKPYKMTDGQMMTVFHTPAGYRDEWTSPNGTTGKDDCVFSSGVTVMTCEGQFTPPGAKQPVTFHEVWKKTS